MVDGETSAVAVSLLPCPFCGGEGEAVCLRGGEDVVISWSRCLSCHAKTADIEDAYSDLPSARAAWNTRVTSTPQAASANEIHWDLRVRIETLLSTLKAGDFAISEVGDAYVAEASDIVSTMLAASPECPQAASAEAREDADEFETVEAWEHDDQRELSLLYNHKAHDGPQFNRGQMRLAIRHGKALAAVPSHAPNGNAGETVSVTREPVAWLYTGTPNGQQWQAQRERGVCPDGWTETPLYAVPAISGEGEKLREAVERIPADAFWQVGHDGEGADPSRFKARVFEPMSMKVPAQGWGDTPCEAILAAIATPTAAPIGNADAEVQS